jgi:hypothetical protein
VKAKDIAKGRKLLALTKKSPCGVAEHLAHEINFAEWVRGKGDALLDAVELLAENGNDAGKVLEAVFASTDKIAAAEDRAIDTAMTVNRAHGMGESIAIVVEKAIRAELGKEKP